MDKEIDLVCGDLGILDDIKDLWEELNLLHLEKSRDFKHYYKDFTFDSRKAALVDYANRGELFIVIAYHKSTKIGYCIASVVDRIGEIDSIYIRPDYRKDHVGKMLMDTSLQWINSCDVNKVIVKVSVGNEEVFGFYSKYGFVPRLTELQLKP